MWHRSEWHHVIGNADLSRAPGIDQMTGHTKSWIIALRAVWVLTDNLKAAGKKPGDFLLTAGAAWADA